MQDKEAETVFPKNRQEWREWLEEHHEKKQAIWLVYGKKNFAIPTLTWSEAVSEALCYGWIDSTRRSLGDDMFMQFFCKRKPKSGWSRINKEKVQHLVAQGLMTRAGLVAIETAKQNGSWTILDDVEALLIPKDLEKGFRSRPGSKSFFLSLSKSVKKMILQWLALAKQPATRQRRIDEIAELAAQKLKPKQFR